MSFIGTLVVLILLFGLVQTFLETAFIAFGPRMCDTGKNFHHLTKIKWH